MLLLVKVSVLHGRFSHLFNYTNYTSHTADIVAGQKNVVFRDTVSITYARNEIGTWHLESSLFRGIIFLLFCWEILNL